MLPFPNPPRSEPAPGLFKPSSPGLSRGSTSSFHVGSSINTWMAGTSLAMTDCVVLSQCRPAALPPGAVPEQPFVLRRAAEGGQHAGPDARCRRRGGLVRDADDPPDRLAEMRIGIGVDPGAVRVLGRCLAGD